MSASLPIRHIVGLARVFGLTLILAALLATPVECLCGDPYPSAHALLEFILSPRTIIMQDDGMPGMMMTDHGGHQHASTSTAPAASSPAMDAAANSPAMDNGMAPTIRDDAGHLERAGSFSAIAGLILFALLTLSHRAAADATGTWRGLRLQPDTPPPRLLLPTF